jgi:plastocyanin
MNTLDSRFIQLGNCFTHRFSASGTFAYALSPIPSSFVAHHGEPPAQAVMVTAKEDDSGTQRQHYVKVSSVEGELRARPTELRVTVGDLVTWSGDKSLTFGFRVRGRIGNEAIDSASMRTESIFTHAFGLPGTYEWADANGSGLRGQVRVRTLEASADPEEWLSRLERGTLVHVRGEQAEPESVDILVGQTVVWAVEDAPGISITDTTLIATGGTRIQT